MTISEIVPINGIFEEIMIVMVLGTGATIWRYLVSIKQKQIQNQMAIQELSVRIEDIRKSVKIISGIFLTYSKQEHPDLDIDHIKDMIEDSLEKKV